MKLFLHSSQQQHRYSCVSDNSCVAGGCQWPGRVCVRVTSVTPFAPGPLVKLRQARSAVGSVLCAARQTSRAQPSQGPSVGLYHRDYSKTISVIFLDVDIQVLNKMVDPCRARPHVGAHHQPGGGTGWWSRAQGFTIRSEAVKLPRKLAAGSNRQR